MGQILARTIDGLARAFGRRDLRLLLLGLDDAGKTTILYKLKLGETVTTIPTIGFNVETFQYRNVNFTVWDTGSFGIRALWRHYYPGTQGLVWVVDSNDPERVMESRDLLHSCMAEPDLQNVVLLVMANKSDLPNAMNVADLSDKLQLRNYSNRTWFIQSCCATTGEGLYEGLDWLSTALKNLP